MNSNEGARKPSNPAREWGEEFVRIVGQIGQPPATELEEALGSIGGLQVLSFTPSEMQSRAVPQEWAGRIMSKVVSSLEKASITVSFKAYLGEQVAKVLINPMIRLHGETLLLEEWGIVPQNDDWGIFDPEKSQEVEKRAIVANYPFRGLLGDPQEHARKMDAWVADYIANYKKNPLE